MSSREKLLAAALILYEDVDNDMDILLLQDSKKRKECNEMFKERDSEGAFSLLVTKHLMDCEVKFKEYFRFSREQFSFLVNLIKKDCSLEPTNRVKNPISPEMKLAVTLRFLATGESLRSMMAFSYRISHSAISTFVPQVLASLKKHLQDKFLPPASQINWNEKAQEFWDRWQFPNCVAGIDGKHVRIISPDNSGSLFHNFKGFFSIVLFAMVDANCKFLLIDVGSYGKEGDAGIFQKSSMGCKVSNGEFFPPPHHLPASDINLPHVIVGDEAFRLDTHVMKPFTQKQAVADSSKRNYNYALCRARRVTESAFGIMCVVFRIFFTPINLKPETVDLVIFVCCCLHNMLRNEFIANNPQTPTHVAVDELPTNNMIPLAGTGGFANSEGFKVRSRFMEYFNSTYYKKHVQECEQQKKII